MGFRFWDLGGKYLFSNGSERLWVSVLDEKRFMLEYYSEKMRDRAGMNLVLYDGDRPKAEVFDIGGRKVKGEEYARKCASTFNAAVTELRLCGPDSDISKVVGLLARIGL